MAETRAPKRSKSRPRRSSSANIADNYAEAPRTLRCYAIWPGACGTQHAARVLYNTSVHQSSSCLSYGKRRQKCWRTTGRYYVLAAQIEWTTRGEACTVCYTMQRWREPRFVPPSLALCEMSVAPIEPHDYSHLQSFSAYIQRTDLRLVSERSKKPPVLTKKG